MKNLEINEIVAATATIDLVNNSNEITSHLRECNYRLEDILIKLRGPVPREDREDFDNDNLSLLDRMRANNNFLYAEVNIFKKHLDELEELI